jgi:hypothetical protein
MKAVWKALHEMVAAKRNKALAASLGSLGLELDAQQNSGLESVQPMKGRLAAGWLRMTTAGATVVECQLVTVRRDAKGNTHEVLGPVRLALESGQDVRPLANRSYEILADGRIIRRMP